MKKKVLASLLALVMVFSLAGTALAAETPVEIDVFGIGDFGGALDEVERATGNPGGAKIVGAMKALTAESANPIVVAGGTSYTGNAISEANHGTPVNEMYKAMGVKYVNVGNHDFDWSSKETRDEVFARWESEGSFTFLNANVYWTEGQKAGERAFTPYAVEEVGGVKVGFFGVIDPENYGAISSLNNEGVEFRDGAVEGAAVIKTLREEEKCDVVVALVHYFSGQAKPDAETPIEGSLADYIPALNAACKEAGVAGPDAVFGSQCGQPHCGTVDGVPVVKAKNYGQLIAQLHIVVDGGKVTVTPSLHPLTQQLVGEESILDTDEATRENVPVDEDFKVIYDKYNEALTALMDAPRGTSDADFSYDAGEPLFNYQKWYLRQNWYYINYVYGEPTVAYFQNTGGIRNIGATQVKEGDPITLRLLYTVAPFDNYIVTMDMTGAEIKKLLSGESQYGTYNSLKQYGLDVTYKEGEYEANGEVESVKLNGQELDDEAVYHIACNTFLYPGPGDKMDFSAGTNAKNIQVINRNAVLNALLDRSATLTDLTVNGVSVEGFDPNVYEYTVHVPYSTDSATYAGTAYNADARVSQGSQSIGMGAANMWILYVASPYQDPYSTLPVVQNAYTIRVVRDYADEISAEYAEAVNALTTRKVFQGNEKGEFMGDMALTRAQVATIVARTAARAAGVITDTEAANPFADELPNWAKPSILWAAEQRLVQGDGTNYYPDQLITAEHFQLIVDRLANLLGKDTVKVEAASADQVTRYEAAAVLAQLF